MNLDLLTYDGDHIEIDFIEYISKFPKTLLYFYPKDNTPGCTTEAQDYSRLRADFDKLGIHIIGVSKDPLTSHEKFRVSCALGIDLLSDPDEILHNTFQVIGEKNMYGKMITGVMRSTFLLDREGNILKEWRNVRATGHADRVLASV